jgi:hypothetical protein
MNEISNRRKPYVSDEHYNGVRTEQGSHIAREIEELDRVIEEARSKRATRSPAHAA